jgi:hypothetical protein
MELIIIESPFAGNTSKNIAYAKLCMKDALKRGEAPLASHLLYTQPGLLNDNIMEERLIGINAGLEWAKKAKLTAVYTDLGISSGMRFGIDHAKVYNRRIEYRTLENFEEIHKPMLDGIR